MEPNKADICKTDAEEVKVSVLMTVYNEENYLRQSINSILSQSEQHIELVVVDDASDDRSPEILKEYADKDHCPCQKACRYHGNCKECVAIHRAHQEHVPNCMRLMINNKLKILSELTEHTLANEIEAPKEILRKEFQK